MTTALDIINGAAKLIGVQFKSEQLDTDEANDALVQLNDMLDSWSNDNLVIYADTDESFPLTGAASYTMGPSGAFNTTRPMLINFVVIRVGGVDYTLDLISQEQYAEIAIKSTQAQIPAYYTYDNAYPLATLQFWMVPTAGSTLYISSNKPLANLSSLTASVALPPGWNRALKYNLAMEMAPQYGAQVSQMVADGAKKSLGAIKRSTSANNPMPLMEPVNVDKPYILAGLF